MNDLSSLLWTQIWQVTAVAAVVFLCVKAFAKDRPHLAHALWVLVLLKCITPPVFSSQLSPFSWMTAEAVIESPGGAAASPAELALLAKVEAEPDSALPLMRPGGFDLFERNNPSIAARGATTTAPAAVNKNEAVSWKWILFSVWLLGAATCILLQLFRLLSFTRQIHQAPSLPCRETESLVADLARQLGLRRKVRMVLTESQISPAVIGLFRPTVLLPASITEQPNRNLRPLIAHELIHIRRGDLWWALLQTVCGSLFWFHPLVRIAVTAITRESERSCDEETIASLNINPADYARSLLDVLQQKQLQTVPALPGVKPVEITLNRLERVMKLGHGSHKRTPWWTWMVLVACSAMVLPGASLVNGQAIENDAPKLLPIERQWTTYIDEVKSDDNLILTCVYDVKDIVKVLQQKNPDADVQEVELKLLRHLRAFPINDPMAKPDPQKKTVLHEGRIITTRTREGHQQLRDHLKQTREHGFREIVIETRILSIPKGTADQINWIESRTAKILAKNGEVRRASKGDAKDAEVDWQGALVDRYPVKVANLLEAPSDTANDVHQLCKADVHRWHVLESTLDKEQFTRFLQANAGKVTHAPTVTLFDGSGGVISDASLRPFVTNVIPITSSDPDGPVAHQPVISLVPDGTTTTISGEVLDDGQFRLHGDLVFSQIDHVDTFTFHPDGTPAEEGAELKHGVTIQLPVVSASKLDFDSTIATNQTMALRFTNPMADDSELVVLMTPTLIDDFELPGVFGTGDDISGFKKGPEFKLERNPAALQEAKVTPLRSAAHFVSRQKLAALFKEHKVSANASEIESEIQNIASRVGMTTDQWKGIVCEKRCIGEAELGKMVEREVCFKKLPPKVQNQFSRNHDQETLIIRSEDPNKNLPSDKVRTFVRGDFVVAVHADISVDENDDEITLAGKELEIGVAADDLQVEQWASGDIQLKVDNKAISMTIVDGLIQMGGPPLVADRIQYDSGDISKIEFAGNVRWEIETATFTADHMQLSETSFLFRGNVKVQFSGSKSLNIIADEMVLHDDGKITVDDIELGLKIDF